MQASNPLPQGLDLSELSGLGLQLPADLADAGSAPAPAPEPVLPTGDLLSGLPLPGVDLSDPLGSLATGGGLDEIPQSDAANETTVDGSAEAVPVNGTTADNSAESETVSQNGVEGTLVVPNIVSCGNLPQCAGRALNDIGRLCDMCTEDCTCVDKDPPAPVFVPTLIPPSQPSTPDAQLKAPSVPLQAPTVRPTNPPVVPKPMEPVPAKPEVEKQFCAPNCPEMVSTHSSSRPPAPLLPSTDLLLLLSKAERCAQCSMDCKSCLTKRPPGAPYGNGTFTGEGPPVVPKPMEPVPAKPEVEKQFCAPNCPEMVSTHSSSRPPAPLLPSTDLLLLLSKAERCAQCSMDCKSCLTKRPPGAPYGNGTFTGEGPQVNNTVTPLTVTPLPPGLMSCSPECNNLDLGGCDICTLKCDCADPTPTNGKSPPLTKLLPIHSTDLLLLLSVTVPTPTTFTGEGPQVNNTVTPGLPPGLMSCSPECDNLDLGGCDICTLACDCADPPKGTPGVPDFPSLFPFANISGKYPSSDSPFSSPPSTDSFSSPFSSRSRRDQDWSCCHLCSSDQSQDCQRHHARGRQRVLLSDWRLRKGESPEAGRGRSVNGHGGQGALPATGGPHRWRQFPDNRRPQQRLGQGVQRVLRVSLPVPGECALSLDRSIDLGF